MSNGQKNAQTSVNVETPLKYMWTSYTSPPKLHLQSITKCIWLMCSVLEYLSV